MKKLIVVLVLFLIPVSIFAVTRFPIKSGNTGIGYCFQDGVRFSAETLVLPSVVPLNGGLRAESDGKGNYVLYPVFLRSRLAMFSISGGVGYDVSNKCFAAFVMPSIIVDLNDNNCFVFGIQGSYRARSFALSLECMFTIE